MKRAPHLLQQALQARVRLLATTLRPATIQQYEWTVRLFLQYLAGTFPQVQRPSDLRRDPHILGWLEHLWRQRAQRSGMPCCNHTRGAHLIRLRKLFDLLADHPSPPRSWLVAPSRHPTPRSDPPTPLETGR